MNLPRRLAPVCLAVLFLGAGCALTKPLVSPNVAEPLDQTLVERPIAQRKGFGEIPKTPPPRLKPGSAGTVRLNAEFPSVPPEVTVLRVETGRPSDPQLRNLGGLFNIPNATIGARPTSNELTFDWKDESGIHWTYHASARRLEFIDESAPRLAASITGWSARLNAIESALAFLQQHGIDQKRFGVPYLEPDWIAWWETQDRTGRCMTAQTITAIRSQSAAIFDQTLPSLPLSANSACRPPEFPARILIRFNALQDGQGLFREDGSPIQGATLAMDAKTGDVIAGTITLSVDPDRSDYTGLSQADARQQLLSGGQGGTPRGDVTITKITFEWYDVKDSRAPQAEYLYSAIAGQGTITYPDQTSAPYRIIVPLVKNP